MHNNNNTEEYNNNADDNDNFFLGMKGRGTSSSSKENHAYGHTSHTFLTNPVCDEFQAFSKDLKNTNTKSVKLHSRKTTIQKNNSILFPESYSSMLVRHVGQRFRLQVLTEDYCVHGKGQSQATIHLNVHCRRVCVCDFSDSDLLQQFYMVPLQGNLLMSEFTNVWTAIRLASSWQRWIF